jgi:hypothetical protein
LRARLARHAVTVSTKTFVYHPQAATEEFKSAIQTARIASSLRQEKTKIRRASRPMQPYKHYRSREVDRGVLCGKFTSDVGLSFIADQSAGGGSRKHFNLHHFADLRRLTRFQAAAVNPAQ